MLKHFLALLVVLLAGPAGADSRHNLGDLHTVALIVEEMAEFPELQRTIEEQVRDQLEGAGIRLEKMDREYFYVNVNIVPRPDYLVFNIRLQLVSGHPRSEIRPSARGDLVLWETSKLGVGSPVYLLNLVEERVEAFIEDYRIDNPQERKRP